jgi:transcriptional regulator with XRE-family HTH domain
MAVTDLEPVEAIRTLLASGLSEREVARRLSVSKGAVWRVKRGLPPRIPHADKVEERRWVLLDPADAAKLDARVSALEAQMARLSAPP